MKKYLLSAVMLLCCATMFARFIDYERSKDVLVGSWENKVEDHGNFPYTITQQLGFDGYRIAEKTVKSEMLYTAEDLAGVLNPGFIYFIDMFWKNYAHFYSNSLKVWIENTDDTTVGGEEGKQFRSTDDMFLFLTQGPTHYDTNQRPLETLYGDVVYDEWAANAKSIGFVFDYTPFYYTGGGIRIAIETSGWYEYDYGDWYAGTYLHDGAKIAENKGQNALIEINEVHTNGEQTIPCHDVVTERQFPIVRFCIEEDDPVPTSVSDVAVEGAKTVTYYNVYGQEVAADAKGVVISSEGKKFFNR